jgi:hypothetical protein
MSESGCATEAIGERVREASLVVHQAQEHGRTECLHPTRPETKGFELDLGVGGTTSGERGYQVETRGARHIRPWPEAKEAEMSDKSSSGLRERRWSHLAG